jgi:hypothetical protein
LAKAKSRFTITNNMVIGDGTIGLIQAIVLI